MSNAKASSSVAGARFSNAGPACAATTLSACAAQRCDASEKKGVPSSSAAADASADANGRVAAAIASAPARRKEDAHAAHAAARCFSTAFVDASEEPP